jgi:glucose/arabinose dehydrogenase
MKRTFRFTLIVLFSALITLANGKDHDSNKVEQKDAHKALGQYKGYEGQLQSLSDVNIRNARLDVITKDLDKPWAFEFLNDEEVLITELGGGMKRLNLKTKGLIRLQGVPQILTNDNQIGLLDIEVHPEFENNQRIYFSHSSHDPKAPEYYNLVVISAVISNNTLENIKTIFDSNPFTWSPSNFGGALEFDDSGFLYIATGDRSESKSSQDMSVLQGKILMRMGSLRLTIHSLMLKSLITESMPWESETLKVYTLMLKAKNCLKQNTVQWEVMKSMSLSPVIIMGGLWSLMG